MTRSRTIGPTDAERVVFSCVRELVRANYDRRRRVRLLGISLSNLVKRERQLMLPFVTEGRPAAAHVIDAVRDRFGYDAIHLGMKSGSRWSA